MAGLFLREKRIRRLWEAAKQLQEMVTSDGREVDLQREHAGWACKEAWFRCRLGACRAQDILNEGDCGIRGVSVGDVAVPGGAVPG